MVSDLLNKWKANARSASPLGLIERDEVRKVARQISDLREWSNFLESHVVFAPSPLVTMVAAGLLTAYWSYKSTLCLAPKRPSDAESIVQIRMRIRNGQINNTCSIIYDEMFVADCYLRLAIDSTRDVAIELLSACFESDDVMVDSLASLISNKKVSDSIEKIVRICSEEDISTYRLSSSISNLGLKGVVDLMGSTFDSMSGGNLQVGIPAVTEYLEHSGLCVQSSVSLDTRMSLLAGPWIAHPKFCIASERPELMKLDERGRFHADDGPACRWRDDTRLYCLEGVRVGSKFVVDPETITTDQLEKMDVAQQNALVVKAPKREQVVFAIHQME